MKNTLETRLGIFVALVVLAAAIVLERVGSFEMFQRGKRCERPVRQRPGPQGGRPRENGRR